MTRGRICVALAIAGIVIACTQRARSQAGTEPQTQEHAAEDAKDPTMSNVQTYLDAFERGEDFRGPATGLVSGGRPDDLALVRIEQVLPTASPAVTENIVALLVDVALGSDPLTRAGAEVIRHPRTIAILAGIAGGDRPDLGREAAASALRKLVTVPELAVHGDGFMHALDVGPSEEAFLLVAKAKPAAARPVVRRLVGSAAWHDVEAARIAWAALGDTATEDAFLRHASVAESANDGQALAHALGSLALIGTPRALRAVAERLRTPLVTAVPHAFEKSVRLDVLTALLYNYPDRPELYPNNIIEPGDYTKAEGFCTTTLGVQYTEPVPEFMTIRGAPIPRVDP